LIQQVSDAFASDPAALTRSLKTYHYAKHLVGQEGGNPRIVLAAALLLEACASQAAAPQPDESQASSSARKMLDQAGVDADTIVGVCDAIAGQQAGREPVSHESRILCDAVALHTLSRTLRTATAKELADAIETQLTTSAAKQWAEKWLAARTSQPDDESGDKS
jgi:hypothetical protein